MNTCYMLFIYRTAGNFRGGGGGGGGGRGVIFWWISIINDIRVGKFVVSESIIANHTCSSLVSG